MAGLLRSWQRLFFGSATSPERHDDSLHTPQAQEVPEHRVRHQVHPAAPGPARVLSCLRPGHQGQARQAGTEGHSRPRAEGGQGSEGEVEESVGSPARGSAGVQRVHSPARRGSAVHQLRSPSRRAVSRRALPHGCCQPRAAFRAVERPQTMRPMQQPQIRRHRELPNQPSAQDRRREGRVAGRPS
ncbi:UNVERIFIED_CONTAM: hypothetical protein NCL1_55212 [Trichonephila clavipes]